MNRWIVWGCFGYLLFPGEPLRGEHGGTAAFEKARKDRGAQLNGKVLNQNVPVFWSQEGTHAFYPHEATPGKREWKELSLQSGETRALEKKPGECEESLKEPPKTEPKNPALISKVGFKSPDGNHVVKLEDKKVLLDGEEIPGIAEEGLHWQDKIYWAPDSSRFVIGKTTKHPVRQVHYVRSSPEDSVQPEHFSIDYPKPGDELNIARPVIVFTDGREPLEVDSSLIEKPYQLRNWGWRRDSERFLFEFIERGFGSHCLIEMQSEARTQRALVKESDEKFVFVYGNSFRRDLKGGDEILWLSERDGWNHLYLLDGKSGKVIRQLTKGKWVVRKVVAVDEAARIAILEISGFYPKQDPYHIHYARLDLDSGTLLPLTDGDGTHDLHWSPDGTHYLARWSRVDQAPTHEIRRFSDGKKLSTISEADDLKRLTKEGWVKPERFVSKDRNGEYDIHGMILRPRDFTPGRRYPVIEAIYAGPHGSFTPKAWSTYHGGMSEMADAGFIVVKLDALGTNHRGRKFQQVAYRNLIDSGLPDRIQWIQAAAEQIPEMDIGRVGIYGGSAGGQSALAALLTHPEFYRARVADCGCHDNRMDKIWWNEQWMDWPVGPHYEANSNLTHIDKLQGDLLLTVGELDRNVDPSSTYQVIDALVKADKDFEFFVIPGAGHGVGERPYLRRKRIEFFQRHLGSRE